MKGIPMGRERPCSERFLLLLSVTFSLIRHITGLLVIRKITADDLSELIIGDFGTLGGSRHTEYISIV